MTYTAASCESGCPFHSTLGDKTCRMCGGPMGLPRTYDRAGFLDLIRNETAYQAGKREHCAAAQVRMGYDYPWVPVTFIDPSDVARVNREVGWDKYRVVTVP